MKEVSLELYADDLVPIIDDGAIASHYQGDGRMIPVLILDCSLKKELYNLMLMHEEATIPGDVCSRGALGGKSLFNIESAFLILQFERPVPLKIAFQFNLEEKAFLVDAIIQARCVYLQPKESGFKVSQGIDKTKILVEVVNEIPKWEKVYKKSVYKKLKKLNKSKVNKDIVTNVINESRKFVNFRMK